MFRCLKKGGRNESALAPFTLWQCPIAATIWMILLRMVRRASLILRYKAVLDALGFVRDPIMCHSFQADESERRSDLQEQRALGVHTLD